MEDECGLGVEAKKRWKQEVKTTLFNIVQEQEGKIRKVEHDQHGTVMVVEWNINKGMMGSGMKMTVVWNLQGTEASCESES